MGMYRYLSHDRNNVASMEFLVHNISHSDLLVQLSKRKPCDHNDILNDSASETVEGSVVSVLARPKFSCFQHISQKILEHIDKMDSQESFIKTCHLDPRDNTDRIESNNTSFKELASNAEELTIRANEEREASIGFRIEDFPIDVKDVDQFLVQGGFDVVQEIRQNWKYAAITAVYFPLISLLLPKWLQVLTEFKSGRSKQVLYLISGAGTPRDKKHSVQGNSTYATACLIALYIHQLYPAAEVNHIHSGSNIFRYDDNVHFMTRKLRPLIEAHRESLVENWGEDWKARFHVTIAYTDGPPARLSALNASLRIYKPSYLHIWQVKTFWHRQCLLSGDIDFHSFENIEASASVSFADADPMVQLVIEEVKGFRDQFLKAQGEGEVESFWLRKSRKPVLAILLVDQQNVDETTSLKVHRGMNCEVSMPTGSLCAERNAIGSALAQDPTLRRRSMKMIAVLAVNFRESGSTNCTVATLSNSLVSNTAQSTASIERRRISEDANATEEVTTTRTCQMTKERTLDINGASSYPPSSPFRPKRTRTYSIDEPLVEHKRRIQYVDRNPLAPCGACKEWLMKIAEANPGFRVITFESEECRQVYITQIM